MRNNRIRHTATANGLQHREHARRQKIDFTGHSFRLARHPTRQDAKAWQQQQRERATPMEPRPAPFSASTE